MEEQTEIWRPVTGYEQNYSVNNYGVIRNKRDQLLKTRIKRGYMTIKLSKSNIQNEYLVHRLVWESFNGLIPSGMQINHINENKLDNRISNLNLMTPKENINWGTHNKRVGEKVSKPVLQFDIDNKFIKEWNSITEAQNSFNKNSSNICQCCRGFSKTAYGYIWKYKAAQD